MQCPKCRYEPTLAEIQAGFETCPKCDETERNYQQKVREIAAQPSSLHPQPVVIVDFRMSFMSMVWFMVKWALAAIPAAIILVAIVVAAVAFFAGVFGGSGAFSR
jgi:hypothetical protein